MERVYHFSVFHRIACEVRITNDEPYLTLPYTLHLRAWPFTALARFPAFSCASITLDTSLRMVAMVLRALVANDEMRVSHLSVSPILNLYSPPIIFSNVLCHHTGLGKSAS